MVMTAVLLCSVGLIVNVIATAGIGNTFSLMISSWAGGSLFIAFVLVALASLILGMGLPVTAAYIVLGTLSAPALYQLILQSQIIDLLVTGSVPESARAIFMIAIPDKLSALGAPMSQIDAAAIVSQLPLETLGLLYDKLFDPALLLTTLLSAHMIIFWLSQDSNVTPPVCLAAFTAAAIAKSPPMKTGFSAWKIAKGLYVVPLLFAYTPLLSGDWLKMGGDFHLCIVWIMDFKCRRRRLLGKPIACRGAPAWRRCGSNFALARPPARSPDRPSRLFCFVHLEYQIAGSGAKHKSSLNICRDIETSRKRPFAEIASNHIWIKARAEKSLETSDKHWLDANERVK